MPGIRGPVGPDWDDVAIVMRELELHHNATLHLTTHLDGGKVGVGLRFVLRATCPFLVGPGKHYVLEHSFVWPCVDFTTVEALVYANLYRMDYVLSNNVWKQRELFPADAQEDDKPDTSLGQPLSGRG